jgi:hypothetical protein
MAFNPVTHVCQENICIHDSSFETSINITISNTPNLIISILLSFLVFSVVEQHTGLESFDPHMVPNLE